MILTDILEIFKRKIYFDKKANVYQNGEDNQYPERIENYINNSVTAKMCSGLMVQYICGRGLGEMDNLKINQNQKLKDFLQDVAKSIVKHKGVYIHFNFNALYEITSAEVLPFNTCRIGKKDDYKYNSKILVHDNWSGKLENIQVIDVYNPNEKVIESQIKKAGGIENYKGQILFYKQDNDYIYPLSRIDAVQLDCDNEHLASVYKNRILRNGFFGKQLIITRPLVDNNIEEFFIDTNGERIPNRLYQKALTEREKFKETIKQFLGAENVDGVLHIESDHNGDTLDAGFKIENIKAEIDDKVFQYTEESTRKNILVAFNNIPVGLVQASEGVFQNNADALLQMKKTYWENTTIERDAVETLINDILRKFTNYNGDYLQILPLITTQNANIIN